MSRYDNCSREELLRRIEELEAQLDTPKGSGSRFRERYACKILDSIPDMLTVLDRDGTLVELVSADETNHVGVPGGELAGQNIRTMLSPAACRNVKNNLDNVFATGCGSSSHHDITLDGRTRNYENRIFPLDGEHALCICRDITEAEAAKHELEMVKYALNNVDEEIYAPSGWGKSRNRYARAPWRPESANIPRTPGSSRGSGTRCPGLSQTDRPECC